VFILPRTQESTRVISWDHIPKSAFDTHRVDLCRQLDGKRFKGQDDRHKVCIGGLIDGVKLTTHKINGDGSNSAGVDVAKVFVAFCAGILDS
jgi:hypothetical protein